MDDFKPPSVHRHTPRTIAGLKLNLEEAIQGRPWLLLPPQFHAPECGKTYPLPGTEHELELLAAIPVQRGKQDAGSRYLRRAKHRLQKRHLARIGKNIGSDPGASEQIVEAANSLKTLRDKVAMAKSEAKEAINEVREEARKAIANLSDLFDLGRRGIEGQMKAHLDGSEWQGEQISARDFRECFRMVTQAVKGLGMPSTQKESAREAIMQQAAEALKDTQEALALAPDPSDAVEH